MRTGVASRLITGALFLTLLVAQVFAQVDDETAPVDESSEVIDELVVVGSRPGDDVDVKVEATYKEFWRQQMFETVERMRLEEEQEWRSSNLTYRSSPESRMVWGYDPAADRDIRGELDFNTNPGVTTKPATLFRMQF